MEKENTYISLEELLNFKNSICIYSVEFEDGLGINIKNKLKDILKNNEVTYSESLKTETESNLILVNGDEFNPSKIGGLIKKYDIPIVICISDKQKLEKLKTCLLKECLILDKNNIEEIDLKENIKQNILEKQKKEQEKLLKESSINEQTENIETNINEQIKSIEINLNEEIENKQINKNTIDLSNYNEIYYLTSNLSVINDMESIFNKKFEYLNIYDRNKKDYDFVFIDVDYSTIDTICNWLENINPCPVLIFGYKSDNIDNIILYINRNILKIEKPYILEKEELKRLVFNYLINYNKKNEEKKQIKSEYDPKVGISSDVFDDEEQEKIRNLYNIKFNNKNLSTPNNLTETKKIINKNNKRMDNDLSLTQIYEKMGLNTLSTFNSEINKGIYFYTNGKVVTYKPEGYVIEYRIKRLKEKGFSNEELNKKLKELEDADIKFQQKKLRYSETKILKNKEVK